MNGISQRRSLYFRLLLFFQDILKQALDDNLEKATELSYFDGDFWPITLEDSIKEIDQEEERKASAAAEAAGDMVCIVQITSYLIQSMGLFVSCKTETSLKFEVLKFNDKIKGVPSSWVIKDVLERLSILLTLVFKFIFSIEKIDRYSC